VLVITNLYYAEPVLTPRSATSAQSLIWKMCALRPNTAHALPTDRNSKFLAEKLARRISRHRNPVYTRPRIILTLRRVTRLLDPIMPRPGRVIDYDLVIASQPYRRAASVEFKASKIVAPWSARCAPRR